MAALKGRNWNISSVSSR